MICFSFQFCLFWKLSQAFFIVPNVNVIISSKFVSSLLQSSPILEKKTLLKIVNTLYTLYILEKKLCMFRS